MSFLPSLSKRIIGLDIMRAIAILSVVYVHGSHYARNPSGYLKAMPIAIDGVSIFFVLSGYLIGGIFIRQLVEKPHNFKMLGHFWLRRWFRTLPNYFLVLSFLLAYRLLVLQDLWDFSSLYLFFSQNLAWPHPEFFPEAWSLSVEEWFYLLLPLCIYGLLKLNITWHRAFLWTAVVFLIVPVLLRIYKFEYLIYDGKFDAEFRKIVILRLDSLMFGVLAAYWHFKSPRTWQRWALPLLFIGLAFLVLLFLNPGNWKNLYRPVYLSLESLASFLFIPYLSSLKSTGIGVLDKLFVFISVISYSMYLLHLSVIQAHVIPILKTKLELTEMLISTPWVPMLAYWILSFLLSSLQYRWFERPMTKIRERFAPDWQV